MARILVALDGQPSSEKALAAAVKLAQQNGGEVAALAVCDRSGDPALERLADGARAEARHRLEEVLQAAANYARSRGVALRPILREGHPAEVIVTCAEEEGSEMLILGSHNRPSPRPGLGGTVDQVSSHAPCTVMIIK
jgi:nucleotide-binding universal stress UspA family protein